MTIDLTPEELEIVHEMEDEDGCQEWRYGYCGCDDCSEPVEADLNTNHENF